MSDPAARDETQGDDMSDTVTIGLTEDGRLVPVKDPVSEENRPLVERYQMARVLWSHFQALDARDSSTGHDYLASLPKWAPPL